MRGFRVWSNYWKKFATEAELHMDGSVDAIFEDADGVPHHENTDITIEQYIGFKDKKGKDIHFGDIVALDGRRARKEGVARIYEVIEDDYYCYPTTIGIDKEDCDIYFNAGATKTYFKVIGNIHENPELLGKEEE